MMRFMAGVASALLLVAAGFFVWKSRAEQETLIPPAPTPAPFVAPLKPAAARQEAPAAPAKSREQKRFARYDENEDGAITRAEMLGTRQAAFKKLDTNSDGRLAFEEWAIVTAEKFAGADKDRSGALNAAEFLTTRRETKPRCKC